MHKPPAKTAEPSLESLVDAQNNSLTSSTLKLVSRSDYESAISNLAAFVFWSGSGRRIRRLYPHQVTAIAVATAYLTADPRLESEGDAPEAALIKMPTGTGKSGVIAVIARCLPKIKRVLVLTPRIALAQQLLQDIRWRFWQHLNFKVSERRTFTAEASEAGTELREATITAFLPSEANDLIASIAGADRLITVGTFQALEQIRRTAAEKRVSGGRSSIERRLLTAIESFDLVIVDEGHYEPAPAWSRAVREFNLHTILLSATPYRNDYKSFRVRGRFVYNYSFAEACQEKTIRRAVFDCGTSLPTAANKNTVDRFVDLLKEVVPQVETRAREYTDHPKIIVRADEFAKLTVLQNEIARAFGQRPILIHDQVSGADPSQRRFHSVHLARKLPDWKTIRFWLHESKLLEGIDDSSFVAIAIYDRFSNARQLVQQVGRALRTTDKSRRTSQTAWVISLPEQHKVLEQSWNRYDRFEAYASNDPRRLVQAEGALPDRLLELMPEMQYLNGEFRPCFAPDAAKEAKEFRVPASASVFEVSSSFDLESIAHEVEEALLAEDRFKPQAIDGMPPGSLAFVYYGWRSSPYLDLRFFPEWTLGLCVLVHCGSFLFVNDTSGIVLNFSDLGMRRADRGAIAKLMPNSTDARPVRISRMGMFSLDVSERAIRSLAMRTRSFADTFGDLLEPVLVPTTTFGFVSGRGRYLGLTRARVTDSYNAPMPLPEFCSWVRARAAELADTAATRSSVFDRYARVRDRLDKNQAAPTSILMDFDDTFAEYTNDEGDSAPATLTDVEYNDLCSDVTASGKFEISLAGKKFACEITFNEGSQRYAIKSEELDKEVGIQSPNRLETDTMATSHINREQSFRVITSEPGVIYAHRRFFEPNIGYVLPDGNIPLLDRVYRVPALDAVTTEKGEKLFYKKRADWSKQSVFGLIKSICEARRDTDVPDSAPLFDELRSFDTLVCDDDGQEIGDFLAIDRAGKRIALIHAKVGKSHSGMSVGALQEVGRQVLASLAFCSAVSREPKIASGRWGTKVQANKIKLDLNRVFRNESNVSVREIETAAANALADRSWNREIWILGGHLMKRETVETAIRTNTSNRAQQFLMFLESLITGCARAHSTLRIFCN